MTEDEAKKKWCPMARVSASGCSLSFNRVDDGTPSIGANCIASDCAMWVWVKKIEVVYGGPCNELPKEQWQGRCGFARV